jgi:hypothetical protein
VGTIRSRSSRRALGLALVAGAVLVAGCFDKPEIEDRWTRLDIEGATVANGQAMPVGSDSIAVNMAITYRRIVTGFAVCELRACSTLTTADVSLSPASDRVLMANDVDLVLANSVSMGRATRAVTGWDHLIQRIDFGFNGTVPQGTTGLFLVCYLAQGDKVERGDGTDTLIVTPFPSVPNELLPVGIELAVAGPGSH